MFLKTFKMVRPRHYGNRVRVTTVAVNTQHKVTFSGTEKREFFVTLDIQCFSERHAEMIAGNL
jgi:hypothetical protein